MFKEWGGLTKERGELIISIVFILIQSVVGLFVAYDLLGPCAF